MKRKQSLNWLRSRARRLEYKIYTIKNCAIGRGIKWYEYPDKETSQRQLNRLKQLKARIAKLCKTNE